LRLRYPLLRQRNQSLFLEGGIAANSTQTDILNTRLISDRQTVIDASLLWQQSGWLDGTTTASLGIYHGTGLFGAMSRSASHPSVAGFRSAFYARFAPRAAVAAPHRSLQRLCLGARAV
jgi:hemolysin activation/secretion protein